MQRESQLLFLKALDARAAAQQEAVVAAQTKVARTTPHPIHVSLSVTRHAASDCRKGAYGSFARADGRALRMVEKLHRLGIDKARARSSLAPFVYL